MTHAIPDRATPRKSLTFLVVLAISAGFAGAASAQGSAGAVPTVYASAWAASQQMAQAATTPTADSNQASALSQPSGEIRVSSRTTGSR